MAETHDKIVLSIPSGLPFAAIIARKLLDIYGQSPAAPADVQVFLPNRRACRTVHEALLKANKSRALILPRLHALGDINEDMMWSATLFQDVTDEALMDELVNMPPAISRLKRQMLLARLIHATQNQEHGFDHALMLAQALGSLMDQAYTEGVSWTALDTLVPADFAVHWQVTLDFLSIITQEWPKILKETNTIDYADRRTRLIRILNESWQKNPPRTPVIAAGSTGSIPAVRDILSTIAGLPEGSVVLPGLDTDMDEDIWCALPETHPQYGLRQLLDQIGMPRSAVDIWTDSALNTPAVKARRQVASAFTAPAETSETWRRTSDSLRQNGHIDQALDGLSVYTCATRREEAQTIALIMRETLEKQGQTAVLITPDRELAAHVRAACGRWNIPVDDSAGDPLDQAPPAVFVRLILEVCAQNSAPVALMALLKHPLCGADTDHDLIALEQALRGPKPPPGFAGLQRHAEQNGAAPDTLAFLEELAGIFRPLQALHDHDRHAFKTLLEAHIEVCTALNTGAPGLWAGHDGAALADLYTDLLAAHQDMPPVDFETYAAVLQVFLSRAIIRRPYGLEAPIRILGPLEARLVQADVMILGGLNEGTWPADPAHDPWMSRAMRDDIGLPGAERKTGLAAHDFVQGFCAPRVFITRAQSVEGVPRVAARWLQRLYAVLDAVSFPPEILENGPHLAWARALDAPKTIKPCSRPAPRPPVSKRPIRLSVSDMALWLKDPYAIYARHILKLKPAEPLEKEEDSALRGTILHEALHRWVERYNRALPEACEARFIELLRDAIRKYTHTPQNHALWQLRMEHMVPAYIAHERGHRTHYKPLKTEVKGRMVITDTARPFTVTARADRIDVDQDGHALIIDYKSAGYFTRKAIESGSAPQLPLEGLIMQAGGFEDVPAIPVSGLQYWILSGGSRPVRLVGLNDNPGEALDSIKAGITALIKAFEQADTPYYSVPNLLQAPRFNDYEHLARVQEWAALTGTDGGEAG